MIAQEDCSVDEPDVAHKSAMGNPHHTQDEEADDEADERWNLLGDFLPKELDLIFWRGGNLDVEH